MRNILDVSSVFFTFLRKILFFWVRTNTANGTPEQLNLDPNKPVCYVLQYSSLANRLVLEQECINGGLPSSQKALKMASNNLRRSFFFLYRRQGQFFRRRQSPALTIRLKQLVHDVKNTADSDIQIVPVSIFWGRAPQKEKSLFKVIFSDTWSNAGRLRKLLTILVHGKSTFVQFSQPISLKQLIEESEISEERATRKTARVLRVHFRRVRQAVIGPDLSHRRTLVYKLISTPSVKDAIRETAKAEDISPEKVKARAYKYGDEIASNVSMATVRFLDIILSWVWNKIYNGVKITNIESVKAVAEDHAVIYTPCHRSHIDYLLLSYVLFNNGIMVPHIAAGINLNMPIVGSILRRGGAFFMRRSFRDNPLYAAIFNEYMHSMLTKGYSVEYFIEGGRSRTGRTLTPKAGMVAMTVRSYLRDHRKPIAFVPVYVGYEKILEGRTYLGELRGQKKESESVFGLFKSLRNLKNSFGQVSVNFGEPIILSDELDRLQPHWKEQAYNLECKPKWLNATVDEISNKIATHINSAAAVNPVTLVATGLLSTTRQAMDERALIDIIDKFCGLLKEYSYSNQITLPDGNAKEWVAYVEGMGLISRNRQDLGDIVSVEGNNAILLTYYRNNTLHLFAVPALIASFFQYNPSMKKAKLIDLVRSVYPYIKSELFIRYMQDDLDEVIQHWLDVMVNNHLLQQDNDIYTRPGTGTEQFVTLGVLARIIVQTLERYYIAIALLRKHGNGSITADELEKQSTQMAQRMSILYGLNAPEFFDKSLFRNFIATLKEYEMLTEDSHGKLSYGKEVDEVADDARLVLNSEFRQSILQVTNASLLQQKADLQPLPNED
ncbi:MAG: glycerol-3-phosphate 1-O-acyltransferase PlsB [Hahellaceae bacterium]|nr:glycerol-3-phosphate 1-O-acyltransferase PlsB [Hahellaceae bacterium]MCP5212357.1 glycerol-3-phosphate 1-O-acyltransferase PlsB [Hahellaceae bacterium]